MSLAIRSEPGPRIKNQFWIQFKKVHLTGHELNLTNRIFTRKAMLRNVWNKGLQVKILDKRF